MTATRELSTLVTDETRLVRAWVNIKGTGTVTIRASYNVSSITDNGAGNYTINFTTAFEDTSYASVCSPSDTNDDTGNQAVIVSATSHSASSSRIRAWAAVTGSQIPFDVSVLSAVFFR